MNGIRGCRLNAILVYPSLVEFPWHKNFDELKAYACHRDGALLSLWSDPECGWFTVQFSDYRHGKH